MTAESINKYIKAIEHGTFMNKKLSIYRLLTEIFNKKLKHQRKITSTEEAVVVVGGVTGGPLPLLYILL